MDPKYIRNIRYLPIILGLMGCGIAAAPGGPGQGLPLKSLPAALTPFTLHPFGGTGDAQSFVAFQRGQTTFADAVRGLLNDKLQNPYLQLSVTEAVQSPKIAAGGRRFDVHFLANGIKIYGAHVSANQLRDLTPFVLGTVPNISASAVAAAPTQWPDLDQTRRVVQEQLVAPGSNLAVTFSKATPYYIATADDRLVPVLRTLVAVNGLSYEVLADETSVHALNNNYFDVDGTAQIDFNNVNDPALVSYKLVGLTGDGSLTSQYLQTFLPSSYTKVNEPTETFTYPASDPRFDEVMAYAHTDDHLNWLLGLGGQTYGDLPLHILLHQFPGGTTNNALFIPGDVESAQPFEIVLGDGDGKVLQNLATDRDVPAHESGHYIIYNYLKTTSGESLALHEGMADLLVFLQQNNPCLGKSICPAISGACIQPGQCLRTADNTYAYNDTDWQEWTAQLGGQCCGHKHGQVLSGLVWDMAKNKVLSAADLSTLTLKAISYFKVDSGIHDYLLALLTADRELFQCKYDANLRQYMQARNLIGLIPDVPSGCTNLPTLAGGGQLGALISPSQPAPTPTPGPANSVAAPDTRKKSAFSSLGCGTVAATETSGAATLAFFLLFAPLLSALPRRRR